MTAKHSKFFFSYAREDSEFVLELAKELRKTGANLWLDQLDILGGQRWDETVQAALESCQGMLAFLSPSAVSSQNFMDEVSYALEEGKQIIPVLHKQCTIPFRLRRVQHVDFTTDYEKGFAELLRALRLEQSTVVTAQLVTEGRASEEKAQPAIHEKEQPEMEVRTAKAEEQTTRHDNERPYPQVPKPEVTSSVEPGANRMFVWIVGILALLGIGFISYLIISIARGSIPW
jgi:hypothetical protein